MSEPNPAAPHDALKDYYGSHPSPTVDEITRWMTATRVAPKSPIPFASILKATTYDMDIEQEPPARYTQEQLASKLYSPQGEPITEAELRAIGESEPKYRVGTWVYSDGHGGKIQTDYHGTDSRDRPTTPLPWQTMISYANGIPRFVCAWPDEETAIRGHHTLGTEMQIVGGVEFMRVSEMERLHKAASEPDRPF